MVTVDYDHEMPYAHDENGERYPRLTLRLASPADPEQAIRTDAYLDSGAGRSLFNGELTPTLGIDLFAGPEFTFQSTTGDRLTARLHSVRIEHDLLGSFDMEVAFSTAHIGRNLLGRDFFSLIQIGFRDRHLVLYVTPQP